MSVVPRAMSTMSAKSAGEITPSCRPTDTNTSSISPRVFMSTPSALASRHPTPVARAARALPTNLPPMATPKTSRAGAEQGRVGEQGHARLQARRGKEERQEQAHREGLGADRERVHERPLFGHHRAQQERPEERVHAEHVGGDAAQQHEDEQEREAVLREASARGKVPLEAPEQRPQAEHERGGKHARARERDGEPGRALGCRHGGDEGEQAPRGHVADGGAGERERPEGGGHQVALDEDAREHRKGGDGERGAEEERERPERHALAAQRPVERHGRGEPERKRHDDACHGHRHRRAPEPAQVRRVEFEAHEEHEHDEPDLAEHRQARQALGGKEGPEGGRPEPAEQRRPEQQPGHHLADHLRLPEPPERHAHQAGRAEHDGHLEEQERKRMHRGGEDGACVRAPASYGRPAPPLTCPVARPC